MDEVKIMSDYDELIKSLPEPEPPKCHFTHMDYEQGEGDEAWYECNYCGCIKDQDGDVIDQETGNKKLLHVPNDGGSNE